MIKGMTRKIALFIVIFILGSMIAGCGLFPEEADPVAPVLKTPKPLEYEFFKVERSTLTKAITGTGVVTSLYYTRHAFSTSGALVDKFCVAMGDYVNAGDVLVKLDSTVLEESYERAELAYEIAKLEYADMQEQYKAGLINQYQLRIKELDVENLKEEYEDLAAAYSNTMLKATVSGKVVYINTDYANHLNPDLEVKEGVTMVAIDSMDTKYQYVRFEMNSTGSTGIPTQFVPGTKLNLTWYDHDSGKSIGFTGEVVGTSTIMKETGLNSIHGDSSSETVDDYYCKITDWPDGISVSDSVSYKYVEAESENCLQIPTNAIYFDDNKPYVYVLDQYTNLKTIVYIEIGMTTTTRAEVTSGLEEGSYIILNG